MSPPTIQLSIQIGLTLILGLSIFWVRPLLVSFISRYKKNPRRSRRRVAYIQKVFNLLVYAGGFAGFTLIWGIDIKGLFIFASSFFALVGIAFFASWSVLSNVTAGVILFFSFPHRMGDKIKILDGDNSLEGVVVDITMFTLQLEDESHHILTIPNNLLIQKAVLNLGEADENRRRPSP